RLSGHPSRALLWKNASVARMIDTRMEDTMAKGQMRPNKEKKKPKADHNKKKKGGPPPSPFAAQGQAKPGANPYGKKG
ncbi:MAG: hypothetical protein ACJ8D4_22305, partial [Xanthobacteraceae bacterium]